MLYLFDMDGTLIDSNGIWKDVDSAFLARRGLPYTQEYYEGVAHTIFPLAAKFTKEFCQLPESEEAIMAEWMDLAQGLYANVPVKPGVRDYLRQCRDRGIRMAVVTSSVPEHCRTALSHLQLLPFFERITWEWRRRIPPSGSGQRSLRASRRKSVPCLMTASPPAGALTLPGCVPLASTTPTSPGRKPPCVTSATNIS